MTGGMKGVIEQNIQTALTSSRPALVAKALKDLQRVATTSTNSHLRILAQKGLKTIEEETKRRLTREAAVRRADRKRK